MELLNVVARAAFAAGSRSLRALASGAAALCCGIALAQPLVQAPAVEFAVKATYLYKFAPFVEWPAGTFASSTDPLLICVVGDDPVADLVDEAIKGQVIGGHPMDVRHLSPSAHRAPCHILYVALRGSAAVAALESVRGTPVLTVTDAASDPRAQGIVNFVVQDNRVRFEIDLRTAAENHLVISSKLLNLAARVSSRP